MKLYDINVLIYAHREESPEHTAYATYIREMADGVSAFGLSEAVLCGFVRIVTNPKIFRQPTPAATAFEFCESLRRRPQSVVLRPGERNWQIFRQLCLAVEARGKLVADAWHAALAVEHGCEWISTDGDFARFTALHWSHPLRRG